MKVPSNCAGEADRVQGLTKSDSPCYPHRRGRGVVTLSGSSRLDSPGGSVPPASSVNRVKGGIAVTCANECPGMHLSGTGRPFHIVDQIYAKGRLDIEELYRLSQKMIGPCRDQFSPMIAKAAGLPWEELARKIMDGDVSAEDFGRWTIKALEESA